MQATLYRPYFGKTIVFKNAGTESIFEIRGIKYVLTVITRHAEPDELWVAPGFDDPVFLIAVNEDMTHKWTVSHLDALDSCRPCSEFDNEAVRFFNLAPYCP